MTPLIAMTLIIFLDREFKDNQITDGFELYCSKGLIK